MKIDMKPVRFGECIVLSSEHKKENMIVDCGSKNNVGKLSSSKVAYQQIEGVFSTDEYRNILLITHFDDDHYNGILEIPPKTYLEKIYLPYYYFDKNRNLCTTFAYYILLAKARTKAKTHTQRLIHLLIKLPTLVKNKGDLYLTKKGDTIDFDTNKFEVIWPEQILGITKVDWEIAHKELHKFLEELVSGVGESENISLDEIIADIEKFSESLEKYFIYYNGGVSLNEIDEIVHNLTTSYHALRKINIKINRIYKTAAVDSIRLKKILAYIKTTHHELVKDMNSSSIIFHEGEKMLFLGDASTDVISYLRKIKVMHSRYELVKVQHHGTKRYFTIDTPIADKYLISNGGYSNRKIYSGFLGLNITGEFYCTNAWQDKSKFCDSGWCIANCQKIGAGAKPIFI